jgi:transcription antitermination factor NusG
VKFNNDLAPIPDFQIEALKRSVMSGIKLHPRDYFKTGEMVKVSGGPLKGIFGKIQRIENENRFIISLDAIKASYEVQIDPALLTPVAESDSRKTRISLPLGMQ